MIYIYIYIYIYIHIIINIATLVLLKTNPRNHPGHLNFVVIKDQIHFICFLGYKLY